MRRDAELSGMRTELIIDLHDTLSMWLNASAGPADSSPGPARSVANSPEVLLFMLDSTDDDDVRFLRRRRQDRKLHAR
jgi:hypothetical protein